MYCSTCGTKLADGAQFCSNCGTKVVAEAAPIGWEILDIRYGGAITGVRTAGKRIRDYLNGVIDRIGELEEPRLYYNGVKGLGSSMDYRRIVSASNL